LLLTWLALGALHAALKSLFMPVKENANEN
jgi:hypothetical protein